jgi:hypothetical protein
MKKARERTISYPEGAKHHRTVLRFVILGGAVAIFAVLLSLHVFAGAPALPAQSAAITAAAQGLDAVSITAEFLPEARQVQARQTMRLQNRSGQTLPDVVIRTYANAFSSEEYSPAAIEEVYDKSYPNGFSEGSITMNNVLLGGQASGYVYDDGAKTVLRIALGSVWQPGQWIDISLEYVIQIPDCAFRFGAASGIYTLGNAFPILSVWENGAWRTEEYFPLGDPFYANCANYSVTLAVPRGYQCAGSAYGEKTETDGKWVFTFDAPAVREFALSISDRFATAQETVGDVLVTSYGLTTQTAWKALKYASQALVCFNEQYGAYPYRHLAIAAVDFPYGGMEYPSLVLIQKSAYEADSEQSLETLIAHEVAHQWWYAVVGSDQFYQPWQDEALAEYALLDYTGKYYGKDARDNLAFSRFETAMRVTIPEGVTPGSPIDYFGSMSEYSLVVYRRGASLMVALETSLGDKFHDFLRTYYQRQAFRLSSRADFEQTLKEVSGQDWSALIVDYLDTYINN